MHIGVAGDAVVVVAAEGGDFDLEAVVFAGDGAVADAGVPYCVAVFLEDLLCDFWACWCGEVVVGAEASEVEVAHAAADEVDGVAGLGEEFAEFLYGFEGFGDVGGCGGGLAAVVLGHCCKFTGRADGLR